MDPFTLALATFGVQKLRGKSTKRALRDAALVGGGSYLVGASGALGPQSTFGQGPAFSTLGLGQAPATPVPKGSLGPSFLNEANMPAGTPIGVDKFGNTITSRGGELSGLNVIEEPKKGIAANLLEKAKKIN
jgi:hypothetical protein